MPGEGISYRFQYGQCCCSVWINSLVGIQPSWNHLNKLRGKERREELLSSCLDIKMYGDNGRCYYFVGTIGAGMRQNIQRSCVIRSVEGYAGAEVKFAQMLPMMNVTFIHNGQLTVLPFPFKYLREYVDSML